MLEGLTHHQQQHHFPPAPSVARFRDYADMSPTSSGGFSRGREDVMAQNDSFRQELERPHQASRQKRVAISPRGWPSSTYANASDAEDSEHMLRRKTPNGTLAAGYDGNQVDWNKQSHPSKYLFTPTSSHVRAPLRTPTSAKNFTAQQSPRSSRSFAARTGVQPYQTQPNPIENEANLMGKPKAEAGWRRNDMPPPGIDSMLNQSPLICGPFNVAGREQVPTVLQPMWPPCLGPISIQSIGPFGPYWPDGAFVPYRPAPLRDPRFQSDAMGQSTFPSAQSRSIFHDPGNRPQPSSSDDFPATVDAASYGVEKHHVPSKPSLIPPSLAQHNSDETSRHQARQHNNTHLAYRCKPAEWGDSSTPGGNDFYGNPRSCKLDASEESLSMGLDVNIESENAQFKEKVLTWAHRAYSSLLIFIEHARRVPAIEQRYSGGQMPASYYNQPPRRPYPSWSNGRSRLSRSYSGSSKSSLHVHRSSDGAITTNSIDTNHNIFPSKRNSSRTQSLPQEWSASRTLASKPAFFSTQQGSSVRPRYYQSCAQPSYVPNQLIQDHQGHPPVATAMHAMEMLDRLCGESQGNWTDGMLLYGCLAYGLGDYCRALKMYSKVLRSDPNNVEAMSNLAATLISLDRRQEAEQYWLRSIKLRPSYFEAVEHLVGLLHEEHRSSEAVKVIDYVEQVLHHPLFAESLDSLRQTRYSDHVPSSDHSGYAIRPADNGRMLALIHGKGNVLYQKGDNVGAAKAFEDAILIGAGKRHLGIQGLICRIMRAFAERRPPTTAIDHDDCLEGTLLLPPEMALETARLVFPSQGHLPGLKDVPPGLSQKAAVSIISNSLLSLAKIYQDGMSSNGAPATTPRATSGVQEILALYYLSLSLQPSPSTANNVGILLAGVQQSARSTFYRVPSNVQTSTLLGVVPGSGISLALAYYDYGLKLDKGHAHLYTNLGSLFKDIGQLSAAIKMYEKAVECDGNFDIALANLANAVKDKGNIGDAINYYKRAVTSNPDFAEAVCGLANALNSVCNWSGRGGINSLQGSRDRWHVDELGILYDAKSSSVPSSGWIERVVAIVDKQLNEGQNWGRGVLRSVGIVRMVQHLSQTLSLSNSSLHGQSPGIRGALEAWAEEEWEGARVVRLVERATKRLGWQIYREKHVPESSSVATSRTRPELPAVLAVPSAPTVLPFHTFTCPLSAKQIRKISQRNGLRVSCTTLQAPWLPAQIYEPPAPPNPQLIVGYISSDFNNHPLAHLMQSVFGFHNRERVKAICYATTVSDGSVHRQQIERDSPVFYDCSSWSVEHIVNQVVADGVHILVNLNGYTRGAKNEVFAARPAPIQMSFMGFAGTLGAEWCDYLLADSIAIPPDTLRPWRGNVDLDDQIQDGNNDNDHDDWVYGENIIFTKETFFCCDHRQSAPDSQEAQLSWPEEQRRRWKMRKELFPDLEDDRIILGNFNQLYKVLMMPTAPLYVSR